MSRGRPTLTESRRVISSCGYGIRHRRRAASPASDTTSSVRLAGSGIGSSSTNARWRGTGPVVRRLTAGESWIQTFGPYPNLKSSARGMLRLSALCRLISTREPPWFSPSYLAPGTTPPSRAGARLNRLWLAALCGGRCLLFVEFVDVPTFHLRVEHFQGSAAGVDLIVMCEIGEAFENTEQLLVP